ncbi:MAG: helix-turn-helix domain-containing protein [Candidatus Cryptobacteroides sp.]
MNQINYFIFFFANAVAFCLAAILGLVFMVSDRVLGTHRKLQKIFGSSLILLALHLLYVTFIPFYPETLNTVLQYAVVLTDISFFIYCIVFLSRSIHTSSDRKTPVAPLPSEPEEEILEEIPEEDTPAEIDDDPEVEEQLENPNVDDFLFFQKVEALMVNEMLFCEQELSREALATAIGTNRTYLVRSIKSATGKTFSEYITNLRTAYAAKLLTTTDEPLDLIGTLVGFRSKSAYYRAFSAAYNCSPSDYRKNSVCLRALEK